MTEVTEAEAPAVIEAGTILATEYPGLPGERSFDCARIPAAVRLDFLKDATRKYISNRLNAHTQRFKNSDLVKAWDLYEAAIAADPLQSVVPKPEATKPPAPDLEAHYADAITALTTGAIRKQTGEAKTRARVDPLVKLVTDTVVRELFDSKKAADSKYTYPMAKKEVGSDGIAFLNARIDAKVAAGADRALLEKMRDTKYVRPAEMMLGRNETKAVKELPSIL